MTKKKVLVVSSIYFLYATLILITSSFCDAYSSCSIQDDDFLGILLFTFSPLVATFFLSLLTYKVKEEVFRAWWGVAKWFVPVIIVATFLFNMPGTSGLGMSGAYADTFSYLILGLLYTIFIITSLVQIFLAYRRSH